MTETRTLPRLARNRVLMSAPTLDEGGDYEGGERWETAETDEAHVATSIILGGKDGDFRHAPLLDIDIPVEVKGTDIQFSRGIGYYLEFKTGRVQRERDVRMATLLVEALDLGSIGHSFFTSTIQWYLPAAVDHELVASSTGGHHHLYLDADLPEQPYLRLLAALARIHIIEPGYAKASIARGHSAARLPWVKKGDLVMSTEVAPPRPSITLHDFNEWLINGYSNLDPDPYGEHA